jgi:hypothetical protein
MQIAGEGRGIGIEVVTQHLVLLMVLVVVAQVLRAIGFAAVDSDLNLVRFLSVRSKAKSGNKIIKNHHNNIKVSSSSSIPITIISNEQS